MNDPQNREETLFEAALSLPPEQRAAHLDKACGGDAQLRSSVERLLQAHDGAARDFLEPPARAVGPNNTVVAAGVLPAEEQIGAMIGRFKLLEKVGEGGFGAVYVAEQREPVKRRVALKIIKLGMDTKQVVARFAAERQALAMMEHPNIAKVFDAGSTEKGRPYFVMELVRGIRITDYCDQNNLSTRARIELFAKVCQAIQHAHQKGIIHRDIKPSNILVTLHDGVPVPKVIDFGIAKATQGELTEQTVYTQLQQFIGTPVYMSPEQAEMTGLDIDTRSDIYSLGVLLYELLTGKTPLDQSQLLGAGIDRMRRMIREQEPARPSTRVSELEGKERTTTAKRHGIEALKLISLLRGDLDWVVMKCLEKDRTRRYETANGVARDLQRYLNNEPVAARPPSTLYRMQKFARRNKLAFAASTAVAMALCLGVVASTWQAIRATRESERAQLEAKRADDNARGEARQRKTAEQATARASQALSMSLEVEGDRLAREDHSAKALAYFARALRLDASNRVAAQRIISLLSQRDFPLPLAGRPAYAPFDPFEVASYSQDGRRFCVRTNQNSFVVLESKNSRMVGKPFSFDTPPVLARLSIDGTRLCVTMTNSVSFWDCDSGRKISEIPGELKALSRDRRIALLGKRVVEADSGRQLCVVDNYEPFNNPVFSPDGSKLAFLTASANAIVIASATGEKLFETATTHHGSWPYLLFTPNNRGLIIGGYTEGIMEEWDLVLKRQGLPSFVDRSTVEAVDTTEDGRMLTGGSRNGEVSLWSLIDGTRVRESCPGSGFIEQILCAENGSWVATINRPDVSRAESTKKWWDTRVGRSLPITLSHAKGLGAVWLSVAEDYGAGPSVAYNRDGSLVKTIDHEGVVRIWRAEDGTLLHAPIFVKGGMGVAVFSPDSSVVATGGVSGEVRLWDTMTGQPLKTLGTHEEYIRDLVYTPDGQYLVSGASGGSIKVWDLKIGKLLAAEDNKDWGTVNRLAIEPGARRLAVAYDNRVRLLELPSLKLIAEVLTNEGAFSVHFSHDGKWLSTAYVTDAARIWNGLTGQGPLATLPHGSGVVDANFSADDRLVLTASYDRTARVWDRASGKPVTEPLPHKRLTVKAVFNPAGTEVITANEAATVWDVRTGRPVSEEFKHEGGVKEACFSPDGKHILTAGRDGQVRIYEWIEAPDNPPAWLADLAEAVGGYRLLESGVTELLADAPQVLDHLRQTLATGRPAGSLSEWGNWYLSDRATRAIAPHSRLSLKEYAAKLAETDNLRRLEEAVDLGVGHALAYQKLAALMESNQPETAALYRRIAVELGGPSSIAPTNFAHAASSDAVQLAREDGVLDPLDGPELLKHEGKMIKVKGEIIRFSAATSSPVYFLNFSGNYRSSLSLICRREDNPAEFRPELLRDFIHKVVLVQGTLINYQGRPEIVLRSLADLKEVASAPDNSK